MFGNNQDGKGSHKNGANQASSVNIIGVNTTIEGEIKSEGDIRIEGIVKGSITTKAKVVVGITGSVLGDITCKYADISGVVKGTIQNEELLTLKSTANIQGDIQANKLIVETGAFFNGNCTMNEMSKEQEHEKEPKVRIEQPLEEEVS